MSELSNVLPVADQISLVLHTSVDFCRKAGVGIGIIQHAAIGAARSCVLPVEEQKHGIERGQYGANNVKTYERAHMYALILAMGLARKTLRRRCTTMRIKVQSVTVFCTLPSVVALIQYHQAHGSESLESVVSPEDRSMIKRVLASAKKLSRYDVQVSISEDGEESFNLEAARVKMMALQGKKRAYRRRHERRIMSKNAGAAGDNEEGGGSDEGRNRVGHEEEMRQDSSHLRPMTRRESSGIFKMDETEKNQAAQSPDLQTPKPCHIHWCIEAEPTRTVYKTRKPAECIEMPMKRLYENAMMRTTPETKRDEEE